MKKKIAANPWQFGYWMHVLNTPSNKVLHAQKQRQKPQFAIDQGTRPPTTTRSRIPEEELPCGPLLWEVEVRGCGGEKAR